MQTPVTVKTIDDLRRSLRPGQRELADWQGGPLAVAAVPGAGKSTGMAVGAAIAIARNQLHARRQLIVVTFTRSAAANIKLKIRENLQALGLPVQGFQVSTLHGFAWAIARSHLELTDLNGESVLVTPNQNHRLLRACVDQWIAANPQLYQPLLEGRQFDGEETERLRRQSVLRTEVLPELASTVIHEAKSSGVLPPALQALATAITDDYLLLTVAAGLYEAYQNELRRQNWMDYDEMILGALRVLEDGAVREFWQQQVFAVFEDEAQDSSPLQTQLLTLLAADPAEPDNPDRANLVRVGDPNQAINSTFTPADPVFFREFCDRCRAHNRLATMTQAGRSAQPIMDAANFVLHWANQAGLTGTERSFREQAITPVGVGDPQQNPLPIGTGLELHTPADIFETVQRIGQRAIALFQSQPQATAAVLVRENKQGQFVARELARWYGEALTIYDVGQQERQSHVPGEMLALLQFCDRPHSPDGLKAALSTLVQRKLIAAQDLNALTSFPEQFLYPGPLDPLQPEPIAQARQLCHQLLHARLELPPYQLIPFFALTLGYDQNELATADKLTERINQQVQGRQTLTALTATLNEIVSSEQFAPVDTAATDDRYTRAGQLTIITMHKAKGLDWDAVFLPFLHDNLIFRPARVPPQAHFLGDFTLAEVARAQIRASLHHRDIPATIAAWTQAHDLKNAEEWRLMYVAMTRAKRLLWLSAATQGPFTWNRPDNLSDRAPCVLFTILQQQFPAAIQT